MILVLIVMVGKYYNKGIKNSKCRRAKNAGKYEKELVELMQENVDGMVGQRGQHSYGIDVLLFRSTGYSMYDLCIRCEVKSSKFTKLNFSSASGARVRQYDEYIKHYDTFGTMTYYFFRIITSERCLRKVVRFKILKEVKLNNKLDRWMVYPIDKIPKTTKGNPKLDFFEGMPLKEFIDIINKQEIDINIK